MKQKDRIWVLKKLSQLLEIGFSLRQAIVAVSDTVPGVRTEMKRVLDGLERGQQLDAAMAGSLRLTGAESALLQAGQRSGRIVESLRFIADLHEKQMAFRKEMIKSLLSPLITLFLATGVMVMISYVVMPRLEEMVQVKSKPFALEVFSLLKRGLPYAGTVCGIVIAGLGLLRINSASLFYRVMYRIPVFGSLRRIETVRNTFLTLGILVSGGVSFLNAMRISASRSGPYVREIMERIIDRTSKGTRLSTAFGEEGLFPGYVSQIMDMAEKSGNYPYYLLECARILESDFETARAKMLPIVNGSAILIVACLVMGMFFSFYSTLQEVMKGMYGH
jgi:type II secretory pathway component PulF